MTGLQAMIAVGLGAAIGALVRYGLSLALNALVPPIPMGTLASNLIAAYVVGVSIVFFATAPGLSPNWRLFIVTGLAGGLSTFSTFSAELLALLRAGNLGWSTAMLALHLGGSLAMTALGMVSASMIRDS